MALQGIFAVLIVNLIFRTTSRHRRHHDDDEEEVEHNFDRQKPSQPQNRSHATSTRHQQHDQDVSDRRHFVDADDVSASAPPRVSRHNKPLLQTQTASPPKLPQKKRQVQEVGSVKVNSKSFRPWSHNYLFAVFTWISIFIMNKIKELINRMDLMHRSFAL